MKKMDHIKYPAGLRSKPIETLFFIIKDCQEAIKANMDNPNNSFYADEICYCGMEIKRRKQL